MKRQSKAKLWNRSLVHLNESRQDSRIRLEDKEGGNKKRNKKSASLIVVCLWNYAPPTFSLSSQAL
jgi:hypothetical protein